MASLYPHLHIHAASSVPSFWPSQIPAVSPHSAAAAIPSGRRRAPRISVRVTTSACPTGSTPLSSSPPYGLPPPQPPPPPLGTSLPNHPATPSSITSTPPAASGFRQFTPLSSSSGPINSSQSPSNINNFAMDSSTNPYTQRQTRPQFKDLSPATIPPLSPYCSSFEAARSFELEDDEIFCPFYLLTEDDLQSINSSASDRSSMSSFSPDNSPRQSSPRPAAGVVNQASSMNWSIPYTQQQFIASQHDSPPGNGYSSISATNNNNSIHMTRASRKLSPLLHQIPISHFPISSVPNRQTSPHPPNNIGYPKLHQPLAHRPHNPIPIVDPSTRSVVTPPPFLAATHQILAVNRYGT